MVKSMYYVTTGLKHYCMYVTNEVEMVIYQ